MADISEIFNHDPDAAQAGDNKVASTPPKKGSSDDKPASSLSDKMDKNDAEYKKNITPIIEDAKNLQEPDDSKFKTMMESAPKPPERSPFEDFGSAASILGVLGSALTRKPLTSALNASAQAMSAAREGREKDFQSAYELWKQNVQHAKDVLDYEHSIYTDKLSKDEKLAGLYGTMFKNDSLVTAAQLKQQDAWFKAQQQNSKILNDTIEKLQTVDLVADKLNVPRSQAASLVFGGKGGTPEKNDLEKVVQDKVQEFKTANPNATPSQVDNATLQARADAKYTLANPTPAKSIDFSALKPSDIVPGTGITLAALDQKVQTLHDTGSYPLAGVPATRAKNNPLKDAVDIRWADKYPNEKVGDIVAKQKGKVSEASAEGSSIGRQVGSTAGGVEELDSLAEPTRQAMKDLDLGHYRKLNDAVNWMSENSDDPKIYTAMNMVQEFANAYTKVLTRNGVRSDAAQAASDKLMGTDFGPNGANTAIDTMTANSDRLMGAMNRLKAGKTGLQNIPEGAVSELVLNPSDTNKKHFDAHFGEGSADKVLAK